jgi:hypothetical protein
MSKHVRTRVRILVKASPQHSDKYQETVCCAGVTDDAQLIRLYPITYRRLAQENQFNRYDLIEATIPATTRRRLTNQKRNPTLIGTNSAILLAGDRR